MKMNKEIKQILKNKPRTIYLSVRDNPKLCSDEEVIELKSVIGSFEGYWNKAHRIKLKENDHIFIWEMDVNDRVVINGKCYIINTDVDIAKTNVELESENKSMTELEAFDNIIFSKRDTEDMPIKSYVSDAYRNDIGKVREALEVLEILKKQRIYNGIFYLITIHEGEKDFEKVKSYFERKK